jgi:uncharacterized protein (DUF2252 family)
MAFLDSLGANSFWSSVVGNSGKSSGTVERGGGSAGSNRRYPVSSGAPHLSAAERAARGKAARAEVPRSSHAVFEPAAHRLDPIDLLERQADARVPELVPIRYGRMLVSPFTFYRGAALIMASDLAATPRSGLLAQCCGDAHLSNFGLYASPERRLVFDINDFDETLPGPWEWDVKRLAVSMLIAARNSGFSVKDQEQIVLETVGEYRVRMAEFAAMRNTDVWYTRFEIGELIPHLRSQVGAKMRKRLDKTVAKALTRDSAQAFSKLSKEVDGERHIVSEPPLIVRLDDYEDTEDRDRIRADLERLLREYSLTLQHERRALLAQFRLVDLARKVVGVGSVGTRAAIALLLGRDGQDPLFLQIKEAQPSVMEEFAGPSEYTNSGERVVAGQRTMQASSDIFLGWITDTPDAQGISRDYYIRQLRDWKGSIAVEKMDPRALSVYGQLCAVTLCHAHARSGDRIAIAAYLGSGDVFDRAILAFSEAYAEQNDRDYKTLTQAVKKGRVRAQHGY